MDGVRNLSQVGLSPAENLPAEHADILLLTGLYEELQWIQRVTGFPFERFVYQGTSYLVADVRRGSRSIRIVTLRQLEKGLTMAAITATKALCIWKPSVVVMTGICAGVRGSVELGDLIVATQCFEHSSGQLRDGYLIPSQNRVAIQPWLLDFLTSLTDSSAMLEQIQASYTQPLPDEFVGKIHYGSMACGPQVIKDQAYIDQLKAMEYSLLGLDMESYGVALAASMCSTHAHGIVHLIVKGVTDFADSGKSDVWHDYCSYASAAFVVALLDQLFSRDHAYARLKGLSGGL
jgi:nucleoside phosphorylase